MQERGMYRLGAPIVAGLLLVIFAACDNPIVTTMREQIEREVAIAEDGGPLTVVSTTPAIGSTATVGLEQEVTIVFSHAMDPATINAEGLSLTTDGDPVSTTVEYDEESFAVTVSPESALIPDTVYALTVSREVVRSALGLELPADVTVEFSTSPRPLVASISPPDGATGIGIDKVITVTFNMAMDAESVESAVSLAEVAGGAIAGEAVYNAGTTSVSFTPSASLERSVGYRVTVSAEAESEKGIALSTEETSEFTTGDVGPEEIRIDMSYAGSELDADGPVYYYFQWLSEQEIEKDAVIGPVTSEGSMIVPIDELSGEIDTKYRLTAYHDRDNSYEIDGEDAGNDWPRLDDHRHFYLSVATGGSTTFEGFLFTQDLTANQFFNPSYSKTEDFTTIRDEALVEAGEQIAMALDDKPFFDPPPPDTFIEHQLGGTTQVDVSPFTRQFIVFESPADDYFEFRITKPMDLAVDVRLWGIEEEPYDDPLYTRFSKNTADIPIDLQRNLDLWELYDGSISLEQIYATEYVLESPMRQYDSDYNYPDPSTRQEYFVIEVRSLDDETFSSFDHTGAIEIQSRIYEAPTDMEEPNNTPSNAVDLLPAGENTTQYFTLEEDDVDWLELYDEQDSDDMLVRIRALQDNDLQTGIEPAFVTQIPGYLKAFTEGFLEEVGHRVLTVTVSVWEDTTANGQPDTQVSIGYRDDRSGGYTTATSHTFDFSFDAQDVSYLVQFNEISIPDYYQTDRWIRIENVTPDLEGFALTGGYMVDWSHDGGGGGK